jgi:hypothetical protein
MSRHGLCQTSGEVSVVCEALGWGPILALDLKIKKQNLNLISSTALTVTVSLHELCVHLLFSSMSLWKACRAQSWAVGLLGCGTRGANNVLLFSDHRKHEDEIIRNVDETLRLSKHRRS